MLVQEAALAGGELGLEQDVVRPCRAREPAVEVAAVDEHPQARRGARAPQRQRPGARDADGDKSAGRRERVKQLDADFGAWQEQFSQWVKREGEDFGIGMQKTEKQER